MSRADHVRVFFPSGNQFRDHWDALRLLDSLLLQPSPVLTGVKMSIWNVTGFLSLSVQSLMNCSLYDVKPSHVVTHRKAFLLIITFSLLWNSFISFYFFLFLFWPMSLQRVVRKVGRYVKHGLESNQTQLFRIWVTCSTKGAIAPPCSFIASAVFMRYSHFS